MKICFIMYPWENVNPNQDSTLRIIHEFVKRGHEVHVTHSKDLTILDGQSVSFCKKVLNSTVSEDIPTFYGEIKFERLLTDLKYFDVLFLRDNPPMDSLMLNFLDSVKKDVFIINDVDGLRMANNKMYTATFPPEFDAYIPKTHISKDVDYLVQLIKESKDDKMILKPLDGYGGRGVIVVEKNAMQNIKSLIDFYVNKEKGASNYVILQECVPGAEEGDVRVLMLGGKPIGALRRVPVSGDIRSNISVGGSVEKYELTKEDIELCTVIGAKLVKDGIFYAGLDLIGGKLIEINVLSPGTITDINKLNGSCIQTEIAKYLEQVVADRNK